MHIMHEYYSTTSVVCIPYYPSPTHSMHTVVLMAEKEIDPGNRERNRESRDGFGVNNRSIFLLRDKPISFKGKFSVERTA